jgi:multiple sugar transport system substrate-binding protein
MSFHDTLPKACARIDADDGGFSQRKERLQSVLSNSSNSSRRKSVQLIRVNPRQRCWSAMRDRSLGALVMASLVMALGCQSSGDAGVTLRFWAMGAEGEVVQQMVPEFERQNPGIHVRVQTMPWSAAHEKLLTSFVGEATPDVAQLGNTWVPEFTAIHALEPLDGYAARSSIVNRDAFFHGIWDTNVIDDTTFGIPWYVDTRVIFYRRDLLAKAGYDSIPPTWAGWRAAMEAVKRQQGANRYAIFLPTNEWAQPMIFGLQAGSPILKDGGRYGAFSDSAFARAFGFYLGLFHDGLAPVAGTNDIANVYQEFARGMFAMWITGPWNVGEMRKRLPPELQHSWATAPLPGPTGDSSGVSLAGGSSIVIFHASAHKDAAWKLLEYLARPEQQLRFSRLTGDLPASVAAWRDSSLSGDPHFRAFYTQLHRVTPIPKVPEVEIISSKLIETSEASIRGNRPADQSLAALDRDVNQILEKRRWILARRSPAATRREASR